MRTAADEEGIYHEVETLASVEIKRSAKGQIYWTTKAYAQIAPLAALEAAATDQMLEVAYKAADKGEVDRRLKILRSQIDDVWDDFMKLPGELAEKLDGLMEEEKVDE